MAATAAARAVQSAVAHKMRVVIVGGVGGGATAAARLRRLDESASITVVERGPDVSFANCGLPYYVGQEIKDRSKLLLHTPGSLSAALAVEVKAHHQVVAIDRASKTVRVQPRLPTAPEQQQGGSASAGAAGPAFDLPYDKLLLSTGAAPAKPPIPGAREGLPGVFTMRTLQDADAMKGRVDAILAAAASKAGSSGGVKGPVGHAVIIGAGFIGLEVVEALVHRGMAVTLVEARDHVLPIMDREMVTSLTNDLRQQGVQVLLDDLVQEIALAEGTTAGAAAAGINKLTLRLRHAGTVTADMVLLATGVVPESGLAKAAGLELDPANGAIVVNEHLQTSDPSIYAVGDAVTTPSLVDPTKKVWIPLGGPANRQARLAAEHMAWGDKADKYRGSLGTSIVRAFNTTVGMTGQTQAWLEMAALPHDSVTVSGYSHASYYPGAQPITLKALFHPVTRKLLGAQAFGGLDGVDKRLDVLATVIGMGGTVDDLAHLELSYAPPFGSARDVVNTLGFAAQNMARGLIQAQQEGLAGVPADKVILDVRDRMTASIHPVHHPTPAHKVLNVPFDDLRHVLASDTEGKVLSKGASYATVCNQGKLSYFSARVLSQAGISASTVVGGLAVSEKPMDNQPMPQTADAAAAPASTPAPAPAASVVELDACGLACPGPILAIRKTLDKGLSPGSTLVVKASDPGFTNDVKAFARSNNLEVLSVNRNAGVITASLRTAGGTGAAEGHAAAAAAGGAASMPATTASTAAPLATPAAAAGTPSPASTNDVAIVVFSGEMDKVLAALVIANGAVAMGGKATLFFTFWGLPALRKDGTFPELEKGGAGSASGEDTSSVGEKASALQTMMARMLPSGPSHLPLSHMNFSGVGPKLMSHVMHDRGLPSVKSLMKAAVDSGKVRFVACTMSMDALGIPASQLMTNVELGGVADFLASAGGAHTTLFI